MFITFLFWWCHSLGAIAYRKWQHNSRRVCGCVCVCGRTMHETISGNDTMWAKCSNMAPYCVPRNRFVLCVLVARIKANNENGICNEFVMQCWFENVFIFIDWLLFCINTFGFNYFMQIYLLAVVFSSYSVAAVFFASSCLPPVYTSKGCSF